VTLGIVKKNEQDFLELIQNEWGFLKQALLNGERIRLDDRLENGHPIPSLSLRHPGHHRPVRSSDREFLH
jgi:hypothetical protein